MELCAVTAGLFLVYRQVIFFLKKAPENYVIYSYFGSLYMELHSTRQKKIESIGIMNSELHSFDNC